MCPLYKVCLKVCLGNLNDSWLLVWYTMASLLLNTRQTYDYFYCIKLNCFADYDLFKHVCVVVSLIILIGPTHTCHLLWHRVTGHSLYLFGHPSVMTANDESTNAGQSLCSFEDPCSCLHSVLRFTFSPFFLWRLRKLPLWLFPPFQTL